MAGVGWGLFGFCAFDALFLGSSAAEHEECSDEENDAEDEDDEELASVGKWTLVGDGTDADDNGQRRHHKEEACQEHEDWMDTADNMFHCCPPIGLPSPDER